MLTKHQKLPIDNKVIKCKCTEILLSYELAYKIWQCNIIVKLVAKEGLKKWNY
jgi:hypothetical protein